MTNRVIAETVTAMGYGKERIKADCAEPKSIDELRKRGLPMCAPVARVGTA